MVINGNVLLGMKPIRNMLDEKLTAHGTSFGLGEAGYDIRIKQQIKFKPEDGVMWVGDTEHENEPVRLFGMGRFTLASAMEEFQMPDNLVGIVHDKSTWARRGLSVFNTVIENGWKGFLTLELVYHGQDELIIPAGSGIAQVMFHQTAERAHYTGKYANQRNEPLAALAGTGTKCNVCNNSQFLTPSGISCPNGHGGASSTEEDS